jgi:hypothetical protein
MTMRNKEKRKQSEARQKEEEEEEVSKRERLQCFSQPASLITLHACYN